MAAITTPLTHEIRIYPPSYISRDDLWISFSRSSATTGYEVSGKPGSGGCYLISISHTASADAVDGEIKFKLKRKSIYTCGSIKSGTLYTSTGASISSGSGESGNGAVKLKKFVYNNADEEYTFTIDGSNIGAKSLKYYINYQWTATASFELSTGTLKTVNASSNPSRTSTIMAATFKFPDDNDYMSWTRNNTTYDKNKSHTINFVPTDSLLFTGVPYPYWYEFTFESEGTTWSYKQDSNYDDAFIKPLSLLAGSGSPTKTGHNFKGWYEKGTDTQLTSSTPVALTRGKKISKTYVAQFTEKTYGPFIIQFKTPGYVNVLSKIYTSVSGTYQKGGYTQSTGLSSSSSGNTKTFTIAALKYSELPSNNQLSLKIEITPTGFVNDDACGVSSMTQSGGSGIMSYSTPFKRYVWIYITPSLAEGTSATATFNYNYNYRGTLRKWDYAGTSSSIRDEDVVGSSPAVLDSTGKGTGSLQFNQKRISISPPYSSYDVFEGFASSAKSDTAISNSTISFAVQYNSSTGQISGYVASIYEAWRAFPDCGTFKFTIKAPSGLNFDYDGSSPYCVTKLDSLTVLAKSSTTATLYSTADDTITYTYADSADKTSRTYTVKGIPIKKGSVEVSTLTVTFNYTTNANLQNSEYVNYKLSTISHSSDFSAVVSGTNYQQATFVLYISTNLLSHSCLSYASVTLTQAFNLYYDVILRRELLGDKKEKTLHTKAGPVNMTGSMALGFTLPASYSFGYPNSQFDTFQGWSVTNGTTINWSKTSGNGKVSYTFDFQYIPATFKISLSIYEIWSICSKLPATSFYIQNPGVSKISDAYDKDAFSAYGHSFTFLTSAGGYITAPSFTITKSTSSDNYYVITIPEINITDTASAEYATMLNVMKNAAYVRLGITVKQSTFLKCADEITWVAEGPGYTTVSGHTSFPNNDKSDTVACVVCFSFKDMYFGAGGFKNIKATYKYKMYMTPTTYNGKKTNTSLLSWGTLASNGVTAEFTAPTSQITTTANDTACKAYWKFLGWDKTKKDEYVNETTHTDSSKDAATYAPGAKVSHTISYVASQNYSGTFSIYEVFKLGYAYSIALYFLLHGDESSTTGEGKHADGYTDKIAFTNNGKPLIFDDKTATYNISLDKSKVSRRGYIFNKWENASTATIKSIASNNSYCTIDLSDAATSENTSPRDRKWTGKIKVNWTPITWKRTINFKMNTTQAVENWPNVTGTDVILSKTWTFNKNDKWTDKTGESFLDATGQEIKIESFVTNENKFFLPLQMQEDLDFLRADGYQLSDWNTKQTLGEEEEGIPYMPGEYYDFTELIDKYGENSKYLNGWYNSTQGLYSSNATINLYAHWIEGTMTYIFYNNEWCRATVYMFDGVEWERCQPRIFETYNHGTKQDWR